MLFDDSIDQQLGTNRNANEEIFGFQRQSHIKEFSKFLTKDKREGGGVTKLLSRIDSDEGSSKLHSSINEQ
jgi:hypothetical protein